VSIFVAYVGLDELNVRKMREKAEFMCPIPSLDTMRS
jgi:hypothetical protein